MALEQTARREPLGDLLQYRFWNMRTSEHDGEHLDRGICFALELQISRKCDQKS